MQQFIHSVEACLACNNQYFQSSIHGAAIDSPLDIGQAALAFEKSLDSLFFNEDNWVQPSAQVSH
jgi:hypothetical protein